MASKERALNFMVIEREDMRSDRFGLFDVPRLVSKQQLSEPRRDTEFCFPAAAAGTARRDTEFRRTRIRSCQMAFSPFLRFLPPATRPKKDMPITHTLHQSSLSPLHISLFSHPLHGHGIVPKRTDQPAEGNRNIFASRAV